MSKVKELYLALEKASSTEEQVELYRLLSEEFVNFDPQRCKECIESMLDLSRQGQYDYGLAQGYNSMGRMYYKKSNYDEASDNFSLAFTYAQQIGNEKLQVQVLDALGMVWWSKGDFEESEKHLKRALDIIDNGGVDEVFKGNIYNNLGNNYERRGDFRQAEHYYKLAMKYLENGDQVRMLANIQGNLAVILSHQKRFAEALEMFQSCLPIFIQFNHQLGEAHTQVNIGRCHTRLKNYAEAVDSFSKAIRTFKKLKNQKAEADAYHGLAEVYLALGGFEESLDNLRKGKRIFEEVGYPIGVVKALSLMGEVHLGAGSYEKAVEVLSEGLSISRETGMKGEEEEIMQLLEKAKTAVRA